MEPETGIDKKHGRRTLAPVMQSIPASAEEELISERDALNSRIMQLHKPPCHDPARLVLQFQLLSLSVMQPTRWSVDSILSVWAFCTLY